MIEVQRLRNLTTGRLHTEMSHIYQDLEFITGMKGLMTHMLPNVRRAVEPWLKEQITDSRFWDGEYDTAHAGEEFLRPMSPAEKELMLNRYIALPHPFEKMASA